MSMTSPSQTVSAQSILRELLDLYGCAVPRDALDAVAAVLQQRAVPRWQFGISEFSLGFDRHGPPKVRALAEVLTSAPTAPADAFAIREIGGHLFETLQRQHRLRYDVVLFDQLVNMVYGSLFPRFRPPKLRFGLAVEWRAGRAPTVRGYFDLFAGGPQSADERLKRVFDRLGLSRHWRALKRLLETGAEMPPCRTVAVDFAPGGGHGLQLYVPAGDYTLPRLRRLLASCGGETPVEQIEAFNSALLGQLMGEETSRGLMLGLTFSDRPGGDALRLRLDAYLPDHHADDHASAEAVAALAGQLGIPLPGHRQALSLLAPDTPIAGLQRLQHYCSLDLVMAPELSLSFRPLETRTSHLAPSRQPRAKPSLLAELDGACRKAIAALERRPAGADPAGMIALLHAARAGFGIDRSRIATAFAALRQAPGGGDPLRLAERMQLAVLARAPEADAICGTGLLHLFGPSVAPGEPGLAEERIRQGIDRWCAGAAGTAAMAQLAYALGLRSDPWSARTARLISGYLVGRQHSMGFWRGGSLGDDFRVTHLAVRARSRLEPASPILARTARRLRETQRADGGWGEAASDPTAGAHALAALALLNRPALEDSAALLRGMNHLLRSQASDGGWHDDGAATAACLEALIVLRPLVEQGLGSTVRPSKLRERAAAARPIFRLAQLA